MPAEKISVSNYQKSKQINTAAGKVNTEMQSQVRTDTTRPIKVAAINFDERARDRLSTAFKIIFKSRCELSETISAEINLVDMDKQKGAGSDKKLLEEKYKNRPSIYLCKE